MEDPLVDTLEACLDRVKANDLTGLAASLTEEFLEDPVYPTQVLYHAINHKANEIVQFLLTLKIDLNKPIEEFKFR